MKNRPVVRLREYTTSEKAHAQYENRHAPVITIVDGNIVFEVAGHFRLYMTAVAAKTLADKLIDASEKISPPVVYPSAVEHVDGA